MAASTMLIMFSTAISLGAIAKLKPLDKTLYPDVHLTLNLKGFILSYQFLILY